MECALHIARSVRLPDSQDRADIPADVDASVVGNVRTQRSAKIVGKLPLVVRAHARSDMDPLPPECLNVAPGFWPASPTMGRTVKLYRNATEKIDV
jgi:hypothetical protein